MNGNHSRQQRSTAKSMHFTIDDAETPEDENPARAQSQQDYPRSTSLAISQATKVDQMMIKSTAKKKGEKENSTLHASILNFLFTCCMFVTKLIERLNSGRRQRYPSPGLHFMHEGHENPPFTLIGRNLELCALFQMLWRVEHGC